MIIELISDLGPWSWLILGLLLLGLEMFLPGVFLLWFGIAALITGALSFVLVDLSAWTWQFQSILFVALSVSSSYVGKRYFTDKRKESDQPDLNLPDKNKVGRKVPLYEAIVNGRGRVRLDDTIWVVEGPDADVGTKVTIASVKSNWLVVEIS